MIPVLYTPGIEYVISQYIDWFERLKVKNMLNMFADPQNISLLGVVRKISGIRTIAICGLSYRA